ncbi:21512_t:CDS:2 [Rhizophagus irregularis]|nr:21512_t:CDS:2 [Rhizophagus irregularis]
MVQKVRVITKKQQREVILCLWNEGVCNASEIQRRTSIGLSTIYYNLKKLEKTGDTAQKPGQGRPKKITDIGARVIGQQIRRYPTVSTNDLTLTLLEKGITVSRHTVGRHLHNYGYKNSLPLAVPMLTAKQKQKRVEWAKEHLNNRWKRTLFTDETSFQLFSNTITQWYKGKRPVKPIPKNRQKIHAWGGFSAYGKTSLFCFTGIMDAKYYVRILEEQLPEVREMMGNNWRFQQDNDPKHTSHLAKNFLQENVPATAALSANLVGANRTYRYDLYSFIDCITAETFEDKLFNNSVHKMRLSRVVDQKNPERKFTREDLNARMFIAPDPNTKTKLPEHINYENDVLVIVTKKTNEKSKFSWLLNSCNSYQTDKIFYGDDIYLTNKATGHELYIERFYKSPTGFTEDFSSDYSNETENFDYPDNYILSSHNSRFGIGNRTFQEVVGHKGRFTENDEWQIEFIENNYNI